MRVKFIAIALVLNVACAYNTYAHNHEYCSSKKKGKAQAKNTSATPEEEYYDVKYVKLNLNMTNVSTEISGDAITRATVVVPGFNVYAFELDDQLTIDSFKLDGQLYPVVTTGSIRKVNLPSVLPQNITFEAQVYYHGQPPTGTGFFTNGLNYVQLSSGTKMMYTLSDPYTAEDWWPAKQSIRDKIDSADIWITVPDGIKAGSNGLLEAVTPMPGNKQRYEWHTRYAVDYYLLSVAVAPYSDYSYQMQFTDGTGDMMLIQNYVYDSLAFMTPARKAALDSTGLIVDYFSKLFGRYPFYKEKYGHCMAETLGGGMEHQTMTTLAYATTPLIAHELGHQWWGNHVTYHTWADIWLSEGLATYCEQLFQEHFWGEAAAKANRTTVFNKVINGPNTLGGTVHVDDTTNVYRIFDSRLTYAKGAAVAHMLRYMAPQDAMYFDVLKTYQQQFAFGLAETADLQQIAEQTYGIDLDTFFTQWIYKEGYPTYTGKWYQTGNQFYMQLSHITSRPASVAYFAMPVEVKLKSAAGDTTIKVYNGSALQNYSFTMDRAITGMEIDPNNHILNKVAGVSNDPTLAVAVIDGKEIEISPNPATDGWHVKNIPANSSLSFTDISGKVLWKMRCSDSVVIPATHLAPGNYLLTVELENHSIKNYKLVR